MRGSNTIWAPQLYRRDPPHVWWLHGRSFLCGYVPSDLARQHLVYVKGKGIPFLNEPFSGAYNVKTAPQGLFGCGRKMPTVDAWRRRRG